MSLASPTRPHSRRLTAHSRLLCPRLPLPIAVCLLFAVSIARAQYVETTIDLAGPLGSVRQIEALAVDVAGHTVYAGGDSWVGMVDGASSSYTGRIPVGPECKALCVAPPEGKLYVACRGATGHDSTLYVVDCGTHQIRARITVGEWPRTLCYDPVGHKIYCGNRNSNSVSVIDAVGDSLVATIPVGTEPMAFCYNPQDRKIYCANYQSNDVTIIATDADTVLATIGLGGRAITLCYNSRDNRVYCGAKSGQHLTVIDGSGDTVLASLSVGGQHVGLAYSLQTDRVFCANGADLVVIDCTGDSVVGKLLLGLGPVSVLANPANHNLYVALSDGRMAVLDGATDSLRAMIVLPADSRRLAADSSLNRVFAAYINTPMVTCVDGTGDSLIVAVRMGTVPRRLCYNPVMDKVYVANYDNYGSVSVIDAATTNLLSTVPVGGVPWELCCDSANNKVYVTKRSGYGNGADTTVTVIDCTADTVLGTVFAGWDATSLCCNSLRGKVYCVGSSDRTLNIVDCSADSLLARIPTPGPLPYYMAYNRRYDKHYLSDSRYSQVMVTDGQADTVRAVIQAPSAGSIPYYDAIDEKLLALPGDIPYDMAVISGRTDSVVGVVRLDRLYSYACQDQHDSRVFMLGQAAVLVYDGHGDSIVTQISVAGVIPSGAVYDQAHHKVYCIDFELDQLTVIDALSCRVIKTMSAGLGPWDMVGVPRHGRVFIANYRGSSVSVIRDTSSAIEELQATGKVPDLPTMVSGAFHLSTDGPGIVVDVAGRQVALLKAGSNRVRLPRAGVYYIVPADGRAIRKLICVEH